MNKPILLHYYITEACNAKCIFCDIWKKKSPAFARMEHVEKNLRDAGKAGCKFVDFTGGEPLLHRDLPAFLSMAKKAGYITSVTTNALLFEKKAPLLTGKIDLLHFSIDSDNREQHNHIRGVSSFDAVIQAVDTALKLNMKPDLLFTYTADNINNIQGIVDFAKKKRIMLILDPVFTPGSPDPLSHTIHNAAAAIAKKHSHVYLNKAHLTLRKQGGNKTDSPRCFAVESALVILPDNRLALPCYHRAETLLKIDNNLSALLESTARKNHIHLQGKHSYCENCHINCYFDPSYNYKIDTLFFQSMEAKVRYGIQKYIVQKIPFTG
ncbi:MAG: radical SAM protein [Fibrobacterota bacterium]